jgi:hypothetical protein
MEGDAGRRPPGAGGAASTTGEAKVSQHAPEHDGEQAQLGTGTLNRDDVASFRWQPDHRDEPAFARHSRSHSDAVPARGPTASGGAQRQARAVRPVTLTGRGAVLLMLTVFTIGVLGASALGWTALAGITFLLGAAAAGRYTRPADLLTVAVTPPLLFICALIGIKIIATGGALLPVFGESLLMLASVAPWLFAGVALNLIIGWRRGLCRCLAELSDGAHPKHTHIRRGAKELNTRLPRLTADGVS